MAQGKLVRAACVGSQLERIAQRVEELRGQWLPAFVRRLVEDAERGRGIPATELPRKIIDLLLNALLKGWQVSARRPADLHRPTRPQPLALNLLRPRQSAAARAQRARKRESRRDKFQGGSTSNVAT